RRADVCGGGHNTSGNHARRYRGGLPPRPGWCPGQQYCGDAPQAGARSVQRTCRARRRIDEARRSPRDPSARTAGTGGDGARQRVVEDLRSQGLLEAMEERAVEVGHSDRSKTPIELYLSKQWFVKMGDVEGGVVCGRGTAKEFVAPGLAQAAMDAAQGSWRSSTGRQVTFHPDPVRYGNTYLQWLAEKRDWCISRQLWWGHRIPIWSGAYAGEALQQVVTSLAPHLGRVDLCV